MKILAIILSCVFLCYALSAFSIIPKLEATFKEFGSDLPFATRLMFDTYKYWIVFALLPVLSYFLLKDQKRTLANILYFLLAFAILFIPIMIFLIYLPIFALGSAV